MKVIFKDVVKRANTKEDRFNTEKIYYVGGEHIHSNELLINERGIIKGSTIGPMFYFGFKAGQVLFVTRNPHLRKAAMVEFDGICSEKTLVLETMNPSVLSQDYLPIIMQSDNFWHYCEEHKSGGVNYFINWSTLADYEFELPSLEEQHSHSQKIWAAYRLRESYKKLLAATDEMVKSQFIEMLFKKPITGKIGDLVDKKIFSVKKIHSMNDIIEYIDISSVERSNHSIVETTSYVVSNAPSRAQQCVRLDDILVSTVRPINRNIAVVNSDKNNLVASTGFCVLRPKLAFKEYLLAIVQSDKYTEAMIDKASGGLYPAVNNGDVLNYGIYIPDEEFAKKFSLIYQQADKSKFELKQCIENIDKVIKSLINR
ncbi:restriction endonuclease subunit S [Bacteroides fragilis]|uniref:restriction endonuclease subunit S n=1 Tax=Bacteroides fragilis TaxID=817 RepID=UPI001C70D78B|nr:restriction endonuclease subunit S [Bacteroides fragilis]